MRDIPYLALDVLPPLRVANDVLRRGESDAGMSGGCRWEPFEIGAEEYKELANKLELSAMTEVPGWVQDHEDWTVWEMERRRGVPADEHRRLRGEYEQAEAAYNEARAQSGEDAPLEGELLKRYEEQAKRGRQLAEFVNRHLGYGT